MEAPVSNRRCYSLVRTCCHCFIIGDDVDSVQTKGADMHTIRAMLRRAERDAAVIDAVKHARDSMQLIHLGRIQVGDYVIDLTDDIQRLTAVLMLLGNPDM
jgi:geranylgeranyl pyrophosphate synthase